MKHPIILLLAACAPGVPDEPSFQQHVAPILAANCVRCHGTPVLGGAPPEFRLDTINSYDRPKRNSVGVETIVGASVYSSLIAMRVASSDNPMPPRFGLDDYQIETLERWDSLGAPRGEPNAGNRAPTAEVESVQRSIEEDGLEIRVRELIDIFVTDPDPDIVGGALQVRQGATVLPLGLLRSGSNAIRWETTNIVPGTFSLEAVLDDGGAEVLVPLGTIDVVAP
jgi:hypothetical protein